MPNRQLDLVELPWRSEADPYLTFIGRIPLDSIVALAQPRKKFKGIPQLADSLAENGQMYPLTTAFLSREEFIKHVELINFRWRTNYDPESPDFPAVTILGQRGYVVLVDGERRFRAAVFLRDHCCSNCKGNPGCILRHFGDERINIILKTHLPSVKVFERQETANTAMPVDIGDQARSLANLWWIKKIHEPRLTLREFAQEVGRSESMLRDAFRFTDAPAQLDKMVADGQLKYGMAVQAARLRQETGWPDKVIIDKTIEAKIMRLAVKDFRAKVRQLIFNQTMGQLNMTDIFAQAYELVAKRAMEISIDREMRLTMVGLKARIDEVLYLDRSGLLENTQSPFAHKDTLRALIHLTASLEKLVDHMENIEETVRKEQLRKLEEVRERAIALERRVLEEKNINHRLFMKPIAPVPS